MPGRPGSLSTAWKLPSMAAAVLSGEMIDDVADRGHGQNDGADNSQCSDGSVAWFHVCFAPVWWGEDPAWRFVCAPWCAGAKGQSRNAPYLSFMHLTQTGLSILAASSAFQARTSAGDGLAESVLPLQRV